LTVRSAANTITVKAITVEAITIGPVLLFQFLQDYGRTASSKRCLVVERHRRRIMEEMERGATMPAAAAYARYYDLILKNQIFTDLTASAYEDIFEAATVRRFGAGQLIVRQGDPARHFHLLVEGRAKLLQAIANDTSPP
jgi:hypothetical protein